MVVSAARCDLRLSQVRHRRARCGAVRESSTALEVTAGQLPAGPREWMTVTSSAGVPADDVAPASTPCGQVYDTLHRDDVITDQPVGRGSRGSEADHETTPQREAMLRSKGDSSRTACFATVQGDLGSQGQHP
ncbi:MAG: hypothetical protein Udaeo2_33650 [Candidatus Udaeobacter sp.]|nr:MAG: hypothetical protein Udaeo2_33650 [Candidatus Udaeobacter sp.]